MKRSIHSTLAAALLLAAGCTSNSVTVITENGDKVKLSAVNENIIRVQAVPDGSKFSTKESLCVLPTAKKCPVSIQRTDTTVVMSTASGISASIDKRDGNICFTDAEGKVLTREHARTFAPIEVEGTQAWTVFQSFDSPADEAFYGLGQHQADEWNYKERNEELYQYNTKISIPFIVSSKGYGILWDSYSFCRWGDPRDYAQLPDAFTLYDKYGKEGALTGTYTPAKGEKLIRRETSINQEYLIEPDLAKVIGAPEGFEFGGSNVTFEGWLEPHETGLYHFLLYYAGYTKVFLDGKEVVPEIWRTAWNPNSHKFQCELEAGRKVALRIEWVPDGGVSYCALKALTPESPEERARMRWWGEMQDQIDYYMIAGTTPDKVISGYRTLTGKAQIMPKWAMGYWQCRERYRSQEDILSTLTEMRRRGIPVDNIVQDWQYWEDDAWGSHEFAPARFPDPQAMVDSIHNLGARYMISVWPKFYTGTEHFNELDSKGWIYQTAVRDSIEDWLGYQQSFYDAYAAGARKLFWDQMNEHLFCYGIDAWWMDASEPNIHDCTNMDYRKAMCGPTALGPSTQYFNAYALMNAQAIYEGQRSVAPDQRVFLLTRSGFAGLQRYSTASWSGDIGTRWEDMKTQLSAGLNFSISGVPYWTQDVGGFSVENRYVAANQAFYDKGEVNADLVEWRELQTRWHQMGMFNPLYRSHGQYPCREAWFIAPEGSQTYETILGCDKMRYTLMPYIYTLASRTWFDDYTIMRPLVMDFTSDAVALGIDDQFMFGDALMVCPVYKYKARSREVYLPEGLWYDLHGGLDLKCECRGDKPFKAVQGGRKIVADAPYEYIPVYARAGQIVVCGPDIQYTAQPQDGSLTVFVFAGADADFTLYEDDGLTYAYERGEYTTTPMHWNDATQTFTMSSDHRDGQVTVYIVSPEGIREYAK